MTWLLAVVCKLYLAGSTLLLSLKTLKSDHKSRPEEEQLPALLMTWTVFGLVSLLESLAEPWLQLLPLYFYGKSALILAVSFPSLRINAAVFESVVLLVDSVVTSRVHIHTPVNALELLLLAPAFALDIVFPEETTPEAEQRIEESESTQVDDALAPQPSSAPSQPLASPLPSPLASPMASPSTRRTLPPLPSPSSWVLSSDFSSEDFEDDALIETQRLASTARLSSMASVANHLKLGSRSGDQASAQPPAKEKASPFVRGLRKVCVTHLVRLPWI